MRSFPTVASLKGQQGVALITILLMVAIASIITMTILNQQQRMAREASVLLRQDQAWIYAKSGEYFLSELLIDDAKNSNKSDNLSEKWAKPMPVFPVEDGNITGRLIDESGKFNLNSLYQFDANKPDGEAVALFGRLLKRVGLSPDLAQSVLDWEDPDDQISGSFGAEDSFYLGQRDGYLAANRPFTQLEELKQVRGFEGDNYSKIAPYITVLPYPTPINVNTASAVVLSALDDGLNDATVMQWVDQRDKSFEYLEQTGDLWKKPAFAQVSTDNQTKVNRFLSVKSDFFTAQVIVTLSDRKRYLTSHLLRSGERVMAYQRSLTPIALSKFAGGDATQLIQQFMQQANK